VKQKISRKIFLLFLPVFLFLLIFTILENITNTTISHNSSLAAYDSWFFSLTAKAAETRTGNEIPKVYDYADLLTSEQEKQLEDLCAKYGKKGKADLVIVTTNEENGKDCEVFLEDLYDEVGFGYNKTYGDTVMIIVDMYTREVCIEGYGLAETRVNQSRGDYIRGKITPKLSAGKYYEAFIQFTKLSAKCMCLKAGINPANPLLLLPVQLILCLGIAAVSVAVMAYHTKTPITTNNQTYLNRTNSQILEQRDDYIRTHTTRVKRQQSSSGSGRSGGGHSGGGTSSGGHSHSTSRGSF